MSRAAVFIAAMICAASALAQTAYFAAIPDLPMAPGLLEGDNRPSYNSGLATLILAEAHGPASPESVARFYRESLSPLGWSYEPSPVNRDLAFVRGRERLVLQIEPRNGQTYLHVRLIVHAPPLSID
jgi:hypothetical protein